MDAMLDDFARIARGLDFHPPRIAIVSNVTGQRASADERTSPAYWVRHVRDAVRFADGVRSLDADGVTTFLELGPDGVLSALAHDAVPDAAQARAVFASALRKGRPEVDTFLAAVTTLHSHGHAIDWPAFFSLFAPQHVPLPTYAFQRERFWLEAARSADVTAAGLAAADHPLLGAAVALADSDGF